MVRCDSRMTSIEVQLEKAKDERLHDAVKVSTGQGDIGQARGDVGRVHDNVLENLVPEFRWQVHGGMRSMRERQPDNFRIVGYCE
jgi:hypothetical protein